MIEAIIKDKKELEFLTERLRKAAQSPAALKLVRDIAVELNLSIEEEERLADIIGSIFRGEVEMSDCATLLSSVLDIDFEKAMEINSRLYENLFFDIEDDLAGQFVAYQARKKPETAPAVAEEDIKKAKAEKSEHAELITRAIKKFNLSLDEAGMRRFAEAAESFLSGARTKAQFRNTLMKETADGGLGMEKTAAENAADYLSSHLRIEELKKPEEKEAALAFSSVISAPSRVIPAKAGIQPAKSKIEIDFSREEKEAAKQKSKIEKIKTEAPKLLSPSFVSLAKNDVTEGVKKALEELNYTYPSSELQERLKTIIDSRVRNVRTAMQTFEMLIAPTRSGGMGFAKEEADKVSLVLNKYLEEKSKDIYESKLAEIKAAEGEEKKKQEERERQKNAERQKVLDAKYTKLTEGKKIPPSPPFLKGREKTAGSLPLEKGEAVRVTPTPLSITPTPPSVIPAPSRVIPAPSRVIPAKAGIQPRPPLNQQFSPPPRPSLEDINFTPKLFGPVEEIGQMTLSDFRKLSGDAKERLQKVRDKLNLLREESYGKYRAGLAAWKKSPIYGEYQKIINQAVSGGIGLDDAIRSAGTLTKEEVDGIINSEIGR